MHAPTESASSSLMRDPRVIEACANNMLVSGARWRWLHNFSSEPLSQEDSAQTQNVRTTDMGQQCNMHALNESASSSSLMWGPSLIET